MNRKIGIIVILAVIIILGIMFGKKRVDKTDLDMGRSALSSQSGEITEIDVREVGDNSVFDNKSILTDVKLTSEYLSGKEYLLANLFNESKVMLGFDGDKIYGKAPVNNYFGKYIISSDNFTIDRSGATMMAGPEKDMQNEVKYFELLNTVNSAYLTDKQALVLVTKKGQEMIFIEDNKTDNK